MSLVRIPEHQDGQSVRPQCRGNAVQMCGLPGQFRLVEVGTTPARVRQSGQTDNMQLNDKVKPLLQAELLCIADSNWILGHWYINCMLNGRELTDFTSMAGIAEEKLGHTRALFRFLEEIYGCPEFQLEFGRDAGQIHSPEFLDMPPENWADFITTLFLADLALWRFAATFMEGSFAPVANLVRRFGEECYFHQLCIDGWIKNFSPAEQSEAGLALMKRLPQALAWFGTDRQSSADILLEEGLRPCRCGQRGKRFSTI